MKLVEMPHADPWVEPSPLHLPRQLREPYRHPPFNWRDLDDWMEWYDGLAPFIFVAFMTLLSVAKDLL